MTVPPKLTLGNLLDIATQAGLGHVAILKGKRKTFGNLAGHVKGMDGVNVAGAMDQRAVRPAAELERRRVDQATMWPGKLIIKGILDVEDARHRGQDRRRRADRLQPWRPPARRRAIFDLRCCREWRTRSAPRSR